MRSSRSSGCHKGVRHESWRVLLPVRRIVSDKIDADEVHRRLVRLPEMGYFTAIDLACSEEGKAAMTADLAQRGPERVVVIACSPREREETFRAVLANAGINPFLMQMVNVREHVAWVTESGQTATDKAFHLARAALARVVRAARAARDRRLDRHPNHRGRSCRSQGRHHPGGSAGARWC